MKVLVTGAGGQLGSSLQKTAESSYRICAFTRQQLDVTDAVAVRKVVSDLGPDVIVNAAAYTAVDKAEDEHDLAFAVNVHGAENLAGAAVEYGARFIHISTDFVFDGEKSSPYLPSDKTHPLGVYGSSKAESERCVRALLGDNALIIRTGWVYAAEGRNFVKTILRLLGEKDSLDVIADQVGTPTWSVLLAEALWKIVSLPSIGGIQHWSDAGVASWYDFAVAIQEEAIAAGLLRRVVPIRPITTGEYPLPARRPAYSVLDKRSMLVATGVVPVHWRVALRRMLLEMVSA